MSTIAVQMSAAGVSRRSAFPSTAVRSRLRLTRRGRLAVTGLVSVPLVAAALWFGLNSGVVTAADGHSTVASAGFEHVSVAPGESLWQIAQQVAPHADPRDVVDALIDMNGLQSTVVTPGQTLVVPPQYAD